MNTTIFTRNNLDQAASPYLRQHKDNPVWWQEWNGETLRHAKETGKPLFVSSGYSTCHWCHVMAQEAFSDRETAAYLNQHFVSIKVDREQRPDIDQYLMSFLTALQEQGGWPLNAFLTPDLRPFYALTYAPARSRDGNPDFPHILESVKEFYDLEKNRITPFDAAPAAPPSRAGENEIKAGLAEGFDPEHGGYGRGQKFPPFCTLLFMLSYGHAVKDPQLLRMAELTLDPMASGGLHDHLQGGFFRYCTDREWTVPHFEKMLYDQAMALWVYSLAFRVLGKPEYRTVAEKVLRCLEETFAENGLYVAAHDADTDHEEGGTYLWTEDELKEALTRAEYDRLRDVYRVTAKGNFEGKNHLVKKAGETLAGIEDKLLARRKQRKQPQADRKLVTSWNCLAGVALVQASRFLGSQDCLKKAEGIAKTLLKQHFHEDRLAHSSCEGKRQGEEFLQDVAGLLLLLTYLQEEKGNYDKELDVFYQKLLRYKQGSRWIESRAGDFKEVPAETVDHPFPSSVSLAELAVLRVRALRSEEILPGDFKEPRLYDFYNLSVLMRNGSFHFITAPQRLPWPTLPLLSLQIQGEKFQDCYKGACRPALLKEER